MQHPSQCMDLCQNPKSNYVIINYVIIKLWQIWISKLTLEVPASKSHGIHFFNGGQQLEGGSKVLKNEKVFRYFSFKFPA